LRDNGCALLHQHFSQQEKHRKSTVAHTFLMESGQWTPDPPVFKTIVNQRMAKKLGIIVKK